MRVFHVRTGDETIRVRVGQRFAIELEGDNTLGYQWSLHPGKLTRLVNEEGSGSVGLGSGRVRFVLEANQVGTERLVAAYCRWGESRPTMGLWIGVDISERSDSG